MPSEWREVDTTEYFAVRDANQPLLLGATISNPEGGRLGPPHMLTTWVLADGMPILRHQCWPVGHTTGFSRPCLYETTLAAPTEVSDDET